MRALAWNLGLALLWAAVTGTFTAENLLLGGALAALILLATGRVVGVPHYPEAFRRSIVLVAFTVWELLLSNLRVARDVLGPPSRLRPALIEIPLDAQSDMALAAFASLVTLTPGSTAVDVSDDRRVLIVHVMHLPEGDAAREAARLKRGFETRIVEVVR